MYSVNCFSKIFQIFQQIADLAINLFKGFFASLIEGPIKKIINDIISGMIP